MVLTFKILLQIVSFGLALLLGGLDYWWHDKRTRRFKQARRIFIVLAVLFLLGSVGLTVFDDLSTSHKEEQMRQQLSKVQDQNDGLQKGIAILSDKSSNILAEQRNSFVSVLDDQREIGLNTADRINLSADLLQSKLSDSIARQQQLQSQQKQMLGNLTGGDSVCYVRPDVFNDDLTLFLQNKGEFPIYDVHVEITDLNSNETVVYDQPTISHALSRAVSRQSLKGLNEKRFRINFQTRYSMFEEDLRMVRVGDKWSSAYRVRKTAIFVRVSRLQGLSPEAQVAIERAIAHARELLAKEPRKMRFPQRFEQAVFSLLPTYSIEIIDDNFPRNRHGQVDW